MVRLHADVPDDDHDAAVELITTGEVSDVLDALVRLRSPPRAPRRGDVLVFCHGRVAQTLRLRVLPRLTARALAASWFVAPDPYARGCDLALPGDPWGDLWGSPRTQRLARAQLARALDHACIALCVADTGAIWRNEAPFFPGLDALTEVADTSAARGVVCMGLAMPTAHNEPAAFDRLHAARSALHGLVEVRPTCLRCPRCACPSARDVLLALIETAIAKPDVLHDLEGTIEATVGRAKNGDVALAIHRAAAGVRSSGTFIVTTPPHARPERSLWPARQVADAAVVLPLLAPEPRRALAVRFSTPAPSPYRVIP